MKTRGEALADGDLTYHQADGQCPHGHHGPARYASTGQCCKCLQDREGTVQRKRQRKGYEQTDARKQSHSRYAASDKGKQVYARYADSPKGKAARARARAKYRQKLKAQRTSN